MRFASYVICGTPRSGSTFLCDLLAGTGIAGHPKSFYRRQDISTWARQWGIDQAADLTDHSFAQAYLASMLKAGRGNTEVFGLRLMWNSVPLVTEHLQTVCERHIDLTALIAAVFGPTLFIHLSRTDKIAQAVSLVRAEQSGLWHRNPDGTERERTAPAQELHYDPDRVDSALDELTRHDAAWGRFFVDRALAPLRLSYEALAHDPQSALVSILCGLGELRSSKAPLIGTAQMADGVSASWARRFRSELNLKT